jgi:DNA-binding beta-propeller fold protein YncE
MKEISETANNTRPSKTRTAARVVLSITFIMVLLLSIYHYGQASDAVVQTTYMPIVGTSPRTGPPPSHLASIELEGARCPSDMDINQTTGLVTITNEFSDNVSLIRGGIFEGNVATGTWPAHVKSGPNSKDTYISHVVSGVTVLNDGIITDNIPAFHESFDITVNPVNGYTYVTDLGRPITIIQGTQRVTDLFVPDFEGYEILWQLAAASDELTGLSYFASWQEGIMTVVDGLNVVDQFRYFGQGGNDIAIDAYRRLMYVANLRANQEGPWRHNISVVDLNTHEVTAISTAVNSRSIAIDMASGYVYVTNTLDDTVTVLRGKEVIATYYSGEEPRSVAVDQETGFAYVANSGERSVTVLRDGQVVTKLELPLNEGARPYVVGVDQNTHKLYVVNRSSVDKNVNPDRTAIECKVPWVHIYQ